jgi:hypothetical protein
MAECQQRISVLQENVNILGGHRFLTGKKFQETNGRISSDGKEQL